MPEKIADDVLRWAAVVGIVLGVLGAFMMMTAATVQVLLALWSDFTP